MQMTTEEAFVKTLQRHGIEHAFGIIGSAFMPISDLFPKAGITFWDCAQLAAIGCPILGDVLYGGVDLSREGGATPRVLRDDDRLCLHAAEMRMDADSALGPKGTTLRAGPPWWWAADLERT